MNGHRKTNGEFTGREIIDALGDARVVVEEEGDIEGEEEIVTFHRKGTITCLHPAAMTEETGEGTTGTAETVETGITEATDATTASGRGETTLTGNGEATTRGSRGHNRRRR